MTAPSKLLDTLAMKVTTTFYRRMNLMLRPLGEPIPEARPQGDFVVGELAPESREAYLALLPNRRRVLDARLGRGARCYVAWDGETLAHARWTAVKRVRVDYLERELQLPPEDLYLYDAYTRPAYRGRGLHRAVAFHVMRLAREEGRRRAWLLTAVENRTGTRAVEALGARRVGMVSFVRFGPCRRYRSRIWTKEPAPRLNRSTAERST